ncbi:hypothetical protein M514_10120, partial [Trichuris suis]
MFPSHRIKNAGLTKRKTGRPKNLQYDGGNATPQDPIKPFLDVGVTLLDALKSLKSRTSPVHAKCIQTVRARTYR